MQSDNGLYITILPRGKIKRDLATKSGKISLEDSTVKRELRAFYEIDMLPYFHKRDGILFVDHYSSSKEAGQFAEQNSLISNALFNPADDFVDELTKEHPVLGVLTGRGSTGNH